MDRGFGLVRPIAMLVLGASVWMLSLLKVLPNDPWVWWMLTGVVAVAGWSWLVWRERSGLLDFVRKRWLHLIVVETVFLVFFAIFVIVKAMNPGH